MKGYSFIIISLLLFSQSSFKEDYALPEPLPFEMWPEALPVEPGIIDEASGIADSRNNPGFLWVQQDSGNPPELFLLSYNGEVIKKIFLNGATNRDWEDVAVGNGPEENKSYIYIAETGDNNKKRSSYAIYRMPEPDAAADTIHSFDKIEFRYPDGSHNAEAIFLDNKTKDIYVVNKSVKDSNSKLYKIPYPQHTNRVNLAKYMGEIPVSVIAAADVSADGNEILMKNYTHIYYWKKGNGESFEATLKRKPITLGYVLEPQGEAICFRNDNNGFYTLSERPFFSASVSLNYYKRKENTATASSKLFSQNHQTVFAK